MLPCEIAGSGEAVVPLRTGIEAAGHLAPLEVPAAVHSLLLRFLRDQPSPT